MTAPSNAFNVCLGQSLPELATVEGSALERPSSAPPPTSTRRLFLGRGLALTALIAGVLLSTTPARGQRMPAESDAVAPTASQLRWMHIRQSSFLVEVDSLRMLIDPWFSRLPAPWVFASAPPPALEAKAVGNLDVVLVTMNAPDRVDAESIRALPNRKAYVLVPDATTAALFRRAGFRRVRQVRPGDRVLIRGAEIRVGPAPDGVLGRAQVSFHVTAFGRTFWHTAAPPPLDVDDASARFAKDTPAEIVFGCASGMNLGDRAAYMSEADAYALARLARARYLIPHSLDVKPSGLGRVLASSRTEPTVSRAANGPKIFRPPSGVWIRVARPGRK